METQGKAATTHSAEDCARQAEIAAKAQAYGFNHDDVLRALDAAGMPKFAVGGMLPKDFVLGQVRIGEATVPAASNPWPEMLVASREIVRLNTQMARLLERWDSEGLPCRRGEV